MESLIRTDKSQKRSDSASLHTLQVHQTKYHFENAHILGAHIRLNHWYNNS